MGAAWRRAVDGTEGESGKRLRWQESKVRRRLSVCVLFVLLAVKNHTPQGSHTSQPNTRSEEQLFALRGLQSLPPSAWPSSGGARWRPWPESVLVAPVPAQQLRDWNLQRDSWND